MNRHEIKQIAKSRRQTEIHAIVRGRPRWLLVDGEGRDDITVAEAAQSLSTDEWLEWEAGRLCASSPNGEPLQDDSLACDGMLFDTRTGGLETP